MDQEDFKTTMTIKSKYFTRLHNIPPPGDGCHTTLLSVANLGILARKDPNDLHDDIRRSIPQGSRKIPDKEIDDAIRKALSDHNGGNYTPQSRPAPVVQDGKAALQKIIDQGRINDDVDLWEASPVRIMGEPQEDTTVFLSLLFNPTEHVFIGDPYDGTSVKTVAAWIDDYKNGLKTSPHICINPLTGLPADKKSGDGTTLRGDANIKEYRYCLVEFDDLPRKSQIKFWSAVRLPVVCLIDSAGKSIHAWLDVQKLAKILTSEQWETHIKRRLYDQILTPMGVDAACSNSARLSRLPGHYRTEKGAYQRLLWLSPEGRSIC
jgi:hypothetical protein